MEDKEVFYAYRFVVTNGSHSIDTFKCNNYDDKDNYFRLENAVNYDNILFKNIIIPKNITIFYEYAITEGNNGR